MTESHSQGKHNGEYDRYGHFVMPKTVAFLVSDHFPNPLRVRSKCLLKAAVGGSELVDGCIHLPQVQ